MSTDPHAAPPARTGQADSLAAIAHVGGVATWFFVGWVASLVVWLVHRDGDRRTAEEARRALNFQLTAFAAMVVLHVVEQVPVLGVVGWAGKIAVGIAALVLSVVAAQAVHRGGTYRYPVSLELVR